MNGLIGGFRTSEDEILRNLAHDFLDRKIWGHIRTTPGIRKSHPHQGILQTGRKTVLYRVSND